MEKKIIMIIAFISIILLAILFILKRDKANDRENADSQGEMSDKKENIANQSNQNEGNLNKNAKNISMLLGNSLSKNQFFHEKTIYNKQEFKSYLAKNLYGKVPSENSWYFVKNVTVIPLQEKLKENKIINILWQDKNTLYIKNDLNAMKGDYEKFNIEFPLVAFNKENNKIGIVNGHFIISQNHPIENFKTFEEKHHIKIISSYPTDNVVVARALNGSNLSDIYNTLKVDPTVKNANIEVMHDFPELK